MRDDGQREKTGPHPARSGTTRALQRVSRNVPSELTSTLTFPPLLAMRSLGMRGPGRGTGVADAQPMSRRAAVPADAEPCRGTGISPERRANTLPRNSCLRERSPKRWAGYNFPIKIFKIPNFCPKSFSKLIIDFFFFFNDIFLIPSLFPCSGGPRAGTGEGSWQVLCG